MKKNLIIGAGAAGLSAMRRLRAISMNAEIKLISRENCLPYAPMSLPYLISGKIKEKGLWLADDDYLKRMKCTFMPGKCVNRIVPDEKTVVYEQGEKENYDALLIATGSVPVKPDITGIDGSGFMVFHNLTDYRNLDQRLTQDTEVLIYGGGMVAMGLAASLLKKGCPVKLVVRSRILRRYFNKDAGDLIADLLREAGLEIIEGRDIRRISKKGEEIELNLLDRSRVNGNVLFCCVGTKPNTSFLTDSGISIKEGVIVDRMMQTNKADIYAAGDVVQAPSFFPEKEGLNAIWPCAIEQGEIAGANMAGEKREYAGWISMNNYHFMGHSASSIGMTDYPDGINLFQEVDQDKGRFKGLSFLEGRLVGGQFVNIPVDTSSILYLIRNKVNIKEKDIGPLLEKPTDTSRYLMMQHKGRM